MYSSKITNHKNHTALKGLISSVLHLSPDSIKDVVITNPIKLGEHYDEKTFVLDINVLLNNNSIINLEMQMTNEHNWQERSLSYLCRAFDQLYQGDDYMIAKPVTHIGFLNFAPFPDAPEFHATYQLLNTKNHSVYSDKFSLHVIDLKHIELATTEDQAYKIDDWAKLFTTTSWEELKMIANKDPYFDEATQTMYELNADEIIQQQCRARREYYKRMNLHKKTLQELEEANQKIEETTQQLAQANSQIEQLKKRIAELESQQ